MKKPLQFADLATAQRKARTGQKLTRADINALARESDRLQALAIARWKADGIERAQMESAFPPEEEK